MKYQSLENFTYILQFINSQDKFSLTFNDGVFSVSTLTKVQFSNITPPPLKSQFSKIHP